MYKHMHVKQISGQTNMLTQETSLSSNMLSTVPLLTGRSQRDIIHHTIDAQGCHIVARCCLKIHLQKGSIVKNPLRYIGLDIQMIILWLVNQPLPDAEKKGRINKWFPLARQVNHDFWGGVL